jgi:hypothetical protein
MVEYTLVSFVGAAIQLLGAAAFGMLIGWYVYYINRYRKDDAQLSDVATLVGVIGGATVLSLFDAKTALFGAYGIGLAIGFFGYFVVLFVLVGKSQRYDTDWFLDGRKQDAEGKMHVPETTLGNRPLGNTTDTDNNSDPLSDH